MIERDRKREGAKEREREDGRARERKTKRGVCVCRWLSWTFLVN